MPKARPCNTWARRSSPGYEACFCQFEGASEAAVAQANERAGVPFDRIVAVVTVPVGPHGS